MSRLGRTYFGLEDVLVSSAIMHKALALISM